MNACECIVFKREGESNETFQHKYYKLLKSHYKLVVQSKNVCTK